MSESVAEKCPTCGSYRKNAYISPVPNNPGCSPPAGHHDPWHDSPAVQKGRTEEFELGAAGSEAIGGFDMTEGRTPQAERRQLAEAWNDYCEHKLSALTEKGKRIAAFEAGAASTSTPQAERAEKWLAQIDQSGREDDRVTKAVLKALVECPIAHLAVVLEAYRSASASPENSARPDRDIEQELRHEIWLNHGHTGMYGDDAEMQCPQCQLPDYKRAPLGDLLIQVTATRLGLRADSAPAPQQVVSITAQLYSGPSCSACRQPMIPDVFRCIACGATTGLTDDAPQQVQELEEWTENVFKLYIQKHLRLCNNPHLHAEILRVAREAHDLGARYAPLSQKAAGDVEFESLRAQMESFRNLAGMLERSILAAHECVSHSAPPDMEVKDGE